MTTPTALITGTSSGIGRATAQRLDAHGWRVFATVRRQDDADHLRHAASERLIPVVLDVTDPASVATAVPLVEQAAPEGLDGLVNNAGIAVPGPLEALPIDELRDQLEVNTIGTLAVTQAFLPLVRRARGRIVTVGSINGRIATPFVGAYAVSKFALEAMSDALRGELRRWGIHVVLIQPGATESAIRRTAQHRARRIASRLGPEARQLYGALMERIVERAGERPPYCVPAERVAAVILRALTARRPRTRYRVGHDARLGALLRWLLPDRWLDYLLFR